MYRYYLLIMLVVSCSQSSKEWKCDVNGNHCDAVDKSNSTSTTQSQGQPGVPGKPGSSCTVDQEEDGILFSCEDGTSVLVPNPKDGAVGPVGAAGSSCTVTQAVNGALITCGTGSVLVLNGSDGQQGPAGEAAPPTAYTVVGIVDPCGDAPGIFDEVFLRLENGQLVASFSDNASGSNTRFSLLVPGSYVTSDGSYCYFSIDNQLQLINEHY